MCFLRSVCLPSAAKSSLFCWTRSSSSSRSTGGSSPEVAAFDPRRTQRTWPSTCTHATGMSMIEFQTLGYDFLVDECTGRVVLLEGNLNPGQGIPKKEFMCGQGMSKSDYVGLKNYWSRYRTTYMNDLLKITADAFLADAPSDSSTSWKRIAVIADPDQGRAEEARAVDNTKTRTHNALAQYRTRGSRGMYRLLQECANILNVDQFLEKNAGSQASNKLRALHPPSRQSVSNSKPSQSKRASTVPRSKH